MSPPSPVARSVHSPTLGPESKSSRLSPGPPITSPTRYLFWRRFPEGQISRASKGSWSFKAARISSFSRAASAPPPATLRVWPPGASLKSSMCTSLLGCARMPGLSGCITNLPLVQLADAIAHHATDQVERDPHLGSFASIDEVVQGKIQCCRGLLGRHEWLICEIADRMNWLRR